MHTEHEDAVSLVDSLAQTKTADCYQCGKCTAGCPMADEMDMMPNQLVRLAQLDKIEKAARSESVWLCVSCQTCSTRCPKSVNCAGVMDALRQIAFENDWIAPKMRRTAIFQKAFLDNVRKFGRLNEVALIQQFKMKAFFNDFSVPMALKDVTLAPKLLQRGKLHVFGESVRDRGVVGRIFDRCMKK